MIGNQDMPGLVTTDECIAAMEQAYTEFGAGTAQDLHLGGKSLTP